MLHEIQPGDVVIVTVVSTATPEQVVKLVHDLRRINTNGVLIVGTETSVHVIRAKAEPKAAPPQYSDREMAILKGWHVPANAAGVAEAKADVQCTCDGVRGCRCGVKSEPPRETWPAWRDVRMLLPNEGKLVLCRARPKERRGVEQIYVAVRDGGIWYRPPYQNCERAITPVITPTHWMPLPGPKT